MLKNGMGGKYICLSSESIRRDQPVNGCVCLIFCHQQTANLQRDDNARSRVFSQSIERSQRALLDNAVALTLIFVRWLDDAKGPRAVSAFHHANVNVSQMRNFERFQIRFEQFHPTDHLIYLSRLLQHQCERLELRALGANVQKTRRRSVTSIPGNINGVPLNCVSLARRGGGQSSTSNAAKRATVFVARNWRTF